MFLGFLIALVFCCEVVKLADDQFSEFKPFTYIRATSTEKIELEQRKQLQCKITLIFPLFLLCTLYTREFVEHYNHIIYTVNKYLTQ